MQIKKLRASAMLRALATLAALAALPASANQICEGVAFMPHQLVVTRAKDQPGIPSQESDIATCRQAPDIGLVDIHTFNHFYTFQVDRDVNEVNEGLVMDLLGEWEQAATTEGFALRLRAEFNSAEASRAEMGFRVQVGYKVYDETGYFF